MILRWIMKRVLTFLLRQCHEWVWQFPRWHPASIRVTIGLLAVNSQYSRHYFRPVSFAHAQAPVSPQAVAIFHAWVVTWTSVPNLTEAHRKSPSFSNRTPSYDNLRNISDNDSAEWRRALPSTASVKLPLKKVIVIWRRGGIIREGSRQWLHGGMPIIVSSSPGTDDKTINAEKIDNFESFFTSSVLPWKVTQKNCKGLKGRPCLEQTIETKMKKKKTSDEKQAARRKLHLFSLFTLSDPFFLSWAKAQGPIVLEVFVEKMRFCVPIGGLRVIQPEDTPFSSRPASSCPTITAQKASIQRRI